MDDISKCIIANKYTAQIYENKPLNHECELEDIISSRRETKQFPQIFNTQILDFGSGDTENNAGVHVPIIIPVFSPRPSIEKNKSKKKRKFTTVEETPETEDKSIERAYSSHACFHSKIESHPLFEEFAIIGVDNDIGQDTTLSYPKNLFEFPHLPKDRNW